MSAGVQQADRLMLAMHLQQEVADLLQHAHAGRLIVHEGAAATVRRKGAAQDEIFVPGVRQAFVFQDVPHRVFRWWGEDSGHRCLRGATADQAGIGARAGRQAQAVEDDRLARARLACKRSEPRPDGQVQGLDQHHVADPQSDQHRRKITRNRSCRKELSST